MVTTGTFRYGLRGWPLVKVPSHSLRPLAYGCSCPTHNAEHEPRRGAP